MKNSPKSSTMRTSETMKRRYEVTLQLVRYSDDLPDPACLKTFSLETCAASKAKAVCNARFRIWGDSRKSVDNGYSLYELRCLSCEEVS